MKLNDDVTKILEEKAELKILMMELYDVTVNFQINDEMMASGKCN